MMTLSTLCQDILPFFPKENSIQITGISSDSRKVEPGNLFVAISGYESDGHNFVEEAVKKGAVALVVEKDVGINTVPVIKVENSRKALALLANRFYGDLSRKLLLVGITGTNGKTTVAFLVESILATAGIETGLVGTVVYKWKGHEVSANRTTPDSLNLHRMLKQMKSDGVEAVVMEVSSHALALHRVLGVKFRAGIFTNLSRDHLDFHDSFQSYGETKAKLFKMLSPDGVGIINGDDPMSELMIQSAGERAVTYGMNSKNLDYRIVEIERGKKETKFSIFNGDRKISLSTYLLGNFNVMNTAAAAIVGLELGFSKDVVQEGIRKVHSVRGRMEVIDSKKGFHVIVDYAHTPDALKNVLNAAREFTDRRLIVVFGCGGERDRGKRPEMGGIASSLADVVFVTSDNPRRENPELILTDIIAGIDSTEKTITIVDRKEAIKTALDEAQEGDTVLIAGKGHETYQEIGGKRIQFDDRVIVEECLKLKKGSSD